MQVLRALAFVFLLFAPVQGQSTVKVYYDEDAIPHLYATDDAALFYGLGYQQMRDFPVETLSNLWSTSGRMAEVAGIRHLDLDADMRHLDIGPKALELEAELAAVESAGTSAERRDMLPLLRAYVAGINAGRQWWLDNPTAIDTIAGGQIFTPCVGQQTLGYAMNIEPVPFFLNETSPQRPNSPTILRDEDRDPSWTASAALTRLFEESISVHEVLRFGIVFESRRLPGSFVGGPANPLRTPPEEEATTPTPEFGSEGWMVKSGSAISTYSCTHVEMIRGGLRLYTLQMHGDRYNVSGYSFPGAPGIVVGFNDRISWWFTNDSVAPFGTSGVRPASVRGFYGEPTPVLSNQWRATIRAITRTELGFDIWTSPACQSGSGRFCPNDETVAIEQEAMSLQYWDFGANALTDDPRPSLRVREWVSEYRLQGIPRFPLTDVSVDFDGDHLADEDDEITFEQYDYAFYTRSAWEFFIRLGRAPNVVGTNADALQQMIVAENLIWGRSVNFCAADDQAGFLYWIAAHVPKQGVDLTGSGTAPRPWRDPGNDAIQILDGTLRKRHWQGVHDMRDVPHLVRDDTADKIWIQNNSSDNFIDAPDYGGIDLTLFADYITDRGNNVGFGQTRQRDVQNLLVAAGAIDQAKNQELALSKRDWWSQFFWPYFQAVADSEYDCDDIPTNRQVCNFVRFVEDTMDEAEDGTLTSPEPFVAHVASQVIPYMMLLRSAFEIRALQDFALGIADDDPNHLFVFDQYSDPPTIGDVLSNSDYRETLRNMMDALVRVAGYHALEEQPGGIYSRRLVLEANAQMFGEGFRTPMPWSGTILDGDELRLGHCLMFVGTPHYISRSLSRTDYRAWRRSFYSSILPSVLDCDDFEDNEKFAGHPFQGHKVAVYPMGGVAESVYATANSIGFNAGYGANLASTEDPTSVPVPLSFFMNFDTGGAVVLSVDLTTPENVVGYHRTLVSSTEFVVDIREYAGQGEDDFFRTTAKYINGDWTRLNIDEIADFINRSIAPRHDLGYSP